MYGPQQQYPPQQYPQQQYPQQQYPPQYPPQPPAPQPPQPRKEDVVVNEFKRHLGSLGWLVRGPVIKGDTYMITSDMPVKRHGVVNSAKINITRMGYPPQPGVPQPLTVNIGIQTTADLGFFKNLLGKNKKNYNFWLDVDQYVDNNLTPTSQLADQLQTFLSSAGIHSAHLPPPQQYPPQQYPPQQYPPQQYPPQQYPPQQYPPQQYPPQQYPPQQYPPQQRQPPRIIRQEEQK